MIKKHHLPMFVVFALALSCRTMRRSTPVEDDVMQVTVSLSNGVLDKDLNQAAYTYELSGCVDGFISGSLQDAKTLSFKTSPIKPNMPTCECRISNISLANNDAFKWVDSKERGLLYRAAGFAFTPDPTGILSASPRFDRRYQDAIAATSFSVNASVQFPQSIATDALLTAQLSCTPELKSVGIYQSKDGSSGSFKFIESIPKDQEIPYSCTQISVWVNSTAPYFSSSSASFKAKAGGQYNFSDKPLALTAPAQNITVVTAVDPNATCDGDKGKVRDTKTGQCIDKPSN